MKRIQRLILVMFNKLVAIAQLIGVAPVSKVIAKYNFNTSCSKVSEINAFISNSGILFVTDRNGKSNSTLTIFNIGSTAIISGLSGETSPKTKTWNIINNADIFKKGLGQLRNFDLIKV